MINSSKSYYTKISGKDSRLRNNLSGKRVDYCARAVITPDPNISVDEIGIPYFVAHNLTKKIRVNRYNKENFACERI